MNTEIFNLHLRLLAAQRLELLKLADCPLGRELHKPQIERAFRDLAAAIKFAVPFADCPYGPGCTKDTCKACRGSGWITEPVYQALPQEMKHDAGRGIEGGGEAHGLLQVQGGTGSEAPPAS